MPPKKMTTANQKRYADLQEAYLQALWDFRHPDMVASMLPSEWRDIPADPIPDKVRITLRVDTDVAKFYRKLGRDYQATMNRVLRMFMLARLTDLLGEDPGLPEIAEVDEVDQLFLTHEADLVEQLAKLRRKRMKIG